jgi:unsaturated rhamnogalacturonyl hydrolase
MKPLICFLMLFFFSLYHQMRQEKPFWPKEKSPQIIGQKIIADFFTHQDYWIPKSKEYQSVHYAEACAAFGIARFAGLMRDSVTLRKLSDRYMKVITDNIPITGKHVDANVYGILPLELYRQTGNEIFKKQGIWLADQQWENPLENGLSNQTRFWIDDVWMIGSLQTQAFRITRDSIYLERAALELETYIKRLQQPNGLFFHGPEFHFYWGRGNGWVAAGLAELLSELPETNPHYPIILEGYQKMMKALLKYQALDGMWRQLIDQEIAWKETSSTAMFGYAMTLGVKSGILKGSAYTKSYRKAWLALTGYLGEDGKISEVCVGTGQQNDINFYLNRPRVTGDFHGQAPLIWFAWSLLLPEKNRKSIK